MRRNQGGEKCLNRFECYIWVLHADILIVDAQFITIERQEEQKGTLIFLLIYIDICKIV